jgi:sugar phosphate isomerase/epimerase
MEYGLVMHGGGSIDAALAMDEIARAGFRFFEYSYSHVSTILNDGDHSLAEIADRADSLGLTPVQIHGPSLTRGFDLGSPDDGTRRWSIEMSCTWLEHASRLNVPVMVEHACEYHEDFEATMALVKESFAEIAKVSLDTGVKVAIENEFDPRELLVPSSRGRNMVVPSRVGCTVPELKEIVSESPDSLGVCLDFGHANLQRPLFRLRDAIRELGSGLIATHIHDNEGRSDQHMLPLMGNIPWDEAIAALAETGYPNPVIMETGVPYSPDPETRGNRLRLLKIVAERLLEEA